MRFQAVDNTFNITFHHVDDVFTLLVPKKYVAAIRSRDYKLAVRSEKIDAFH